MVLKPAVKYQRIAHTKACPGTTTDGQMSIHWSSSQKPLVIRVRKERRNEQADQRSARGRDGNRACSAAVAASTAGAIRIDAPLRE